MNTKTTLIKGGTPATFIKDKLISDKFAILSKDDKIVDISKNITIYGNYNFVDPNGIIVTSGFVDTYQHLWERSFKRIAGNWSLMEYLPLMLGKMPKNRTIRTTTGILNTF